MRTIVQAALNNEWLEKQGVISLYKAWLAYYYTDGAPSAMR
jgi:hypothetical protein